MKTKKQKISTYTFIFLLLCVAVFAGQYLYNQMQKEGKGVLLENAQESTDQDEGEEASDE